ncbi:MAG: type II toxin-antitoxin system death-on-curing family toxin [bacterium]|jgi:death-on-curing protein
MVRIKFVSREQVLAIHGEMIRQFGGEPGLADFGMLESALTMTKASFGGEYLHRDIFEMAAAYAFHIAKNHPFIDGNKRTAFMTAMVFLKVNGFEFNDVGRTLECAMLAIAS